MKIGPAAVIAVDVKSFRQKPNCEQPAVGSDGPPSDRGRGQQVLAIGGDDVHLLADVAGDRGVLEEVRVGRGREHRRLVEER
jgi:hypothetical protein